MTKRRTRGRALVGLVAASALVLAGCSSSDSSEDSSSDSSDAAGGKEINLAVFNGWDEGIATSELWKAVLEEKGYTVNLEYADVAPLFSGLASGDYDFTTDVWLPTTHASYIEQFGDQIEELGAWNEDAKLTIAVNDSAPITSLTELAGAADQFGNQIVGIEPGAGLTITTEEKVIPDYGLEGMQFTTSSTAAMLTELKAAVDSNENIVVTLWEPHWAYGAYPIRNLEDPDGALGGTESMNTYGRSGFSDDFPEVAGWLGNFKMDLDTLYDLEQVLFVENDTDDYGPLVKQWIEENRDYVDNLTA